VRATRIHALKTLGQAACSARHRVAPSPHAVAARLAAATVAATMALFAALLVLADRADETSGDLLVLFAPGLSEPAVLAAVAASDGVVRRRGPLGLGWELTGMTPGLAGRLRRHGAVLVLPTSPFAGLSLGGCSYLPAERYPRPDLAKLRAGPM
jgi:hypothetical protein